MHIPPTWEMQASLKLRIMGVSLLQPHGFPQEFLRLQAEHDRSLCCHILPQYLMSYIIARFIKLDDALFLTVYLGRHE